MPVTRRRIVADAKAKRIGKELEMLRVAVQPKWQGADEQGIPVRRGTLRYLLEAHDTFPGVLDGLSADFDQVVKALKEAAVLLRKGRV